MVNNIKNNTISEIDAKKYLNALDEMRKTEITKYKKHTPEHKKLLILFNKLILTDKTSESQEDEHKNEIKKVESKKDENKKGNENENAKNKKTIINTKKMRMKLKMRI